MLPTYRFTLVPCGATTALTAGRISVPVTVVVDLEFGEASTGVTAAQMASVLDACPIWSSEPFYRLELHSGRTVIASERIEAVASPGETKKLLLEYLCGPGARSTTRPKNRVHDGDFEALLTDQLVDVEQLYRDTVLARSAVVVSSLAEACAESRTESSLRARSAALRASLRSVNAAFLRYQAQMRTSKALASPLRIVALSNVHQKATLRFFDALDTDLPRFMKLVRGERHVSDNRVSPLRPVAGSADTVVSETELKARLAQRDPNSLLSSAARDAFLAREVGLAWRINAVFPAHALSLPDCILRLVVPTGANPNITIEPPRATATSFDAGIVYPTPGSPDNRNGGLAWLNDASGAPRYRTSVVNADHEIVKSAFDTELVTSTSTDGPGGEGLTQATSPGVVFIANNDDLLAKGQGGQVLRFEDLNIGFKVDMRPASLAKFLCLHAEKFEYLLKGPAGHALNWRTGSGEGFIDREQIGATGSYITNEMFAFAGHGKSQSVPWRSTKGFEGESPVSEVIEKRVQQQLASIYPLLYALKYSYRIRTVFQGGVSLDDAEANNYLKGLHPTRAKLYEQAFEFPRVEAFSAGPLLRCGEAPAAEERDSETVIVGRGKSARYCDIRILPQPLDRDQARYHAILGMRRAEYDQLQHVYLTSDARSLLAEKGGVLSRKTYFCDPDVSSVRITAWRVGHNRREPQLLFGAPSESLDRVTNLAIGEVVLKYGTAGDWKGYIPVKLTVRATDDPSPSLSKVFDETAELRLPPGQIVELSISPVVSPEKLKRTAFAHQLKTLGLDTDAPDVLKAIEPLCIRDQFLRCVHAVARPLRSPVIEDVRFKRSSGETVGSLEGRIVVEAESTGSIGVNCDWTDVDDDPKFPAPIKLSRSSRTPPRDIRFVPLAGHPELLGEAQFTFASGGAVAVPHPSALDAYAMENLVTYPLKQLGNSDAKKQQLEFPDTRRRIVSVTCRARSRFVPAGRPGEEIVSNAFQFDLPNTGIPPTPQLSHAIPTIGPIKASTLANGDRSLKRSFGVRLFFDRPWNLTGPGECAAIACSRDPSPLRAYEKLPITFWGEDVFERGKWDASRRGPLAEDFRAHGQEKAEYFEDTIHVGEAKVPFKVALASFALELDPVEQLWFCDVALRPEFAGWLGLAVYRHQPVSVPGCTLSESPTWAFVRKFSDDVVVVARRDAALEIRVGPTFDKNLSFDLCTGSDRGSLISDLSIVGKLSVTETRFGRLHYLRVPDIHRRLYLRKWKLNAPVDIIKLG